MPEQQFQKHPDQLALQFWGDPGLKSHVGTWHRYLIPNLHTRNKKWLCIKSKSGQGKDTFPKGGFLFPKEKSVKPSSFMISWVASSHLEGSHSTGQQAERAASPLNEWFNCWCCHVGRWFGSILNRCQDTGNFAFYNYFISQGFLLSDLCRSFVFGPKPVES